MEHPKKAKRARTAPVPMSLDPVTSTDSGNGIFVTENRHVIGTGYNAAPSSDTFFSGSGVS